MNSSSARGHRRAQREACKRLDENSCSQQGRESLLQRSCAQNCVKPQDCGTIQLLEPFLRAGQPGPMQLEALSALYNLCKISKVRQEAAAVAHAVPHLTRLASGSRPGAPTPARLLLPSHRTSLQGA